MLCDWTQISWLAAKILSRPSINSAFLGFHSVLEKK
mgnify:CR=1 FL=1